MSFGFSLVNSECGAYLAVDQFTIIAKMFLLFFSLILSLIPGLKPSFLIKSRFRFRLFLCF